MYIVHSNGSGRQADILKDPFGIVAIGVWLCVADATGGHSQLRATKAFQEGVWPLLLLQQAPVCPFPQSHHQAHQSDNKKHNVTVLYFTMTVTQKVHILKPWYKNRTREFQSVNFLQLS